jgi:hypothetical protein
MPVSVSTKKAVQPVETKDDQSCAIQVKAKLVALNGGVVLAMCIMLTALGVAALLTNRFAITQIALLSVFALGSWVYLLDGVTERLTLVGNTIVRTSLIGGRIVINLVDIMNLYLVHEGLNQEIGIESLSARYRDGHEEKLPLGPCWRRHELEAFLASVEHALGKTKLLKEVR